VASTRSTRTTRGRAAQPGALPVLGLDTGVPAAAVLALPTRPGDGGVALLATSPVDVDGLLEREQAKGEPGEVVAVPVPGEGPLERVLLAGTGAAAPGDLRKAGAALARRARGAASLAVDLRGLELDGDALRALAEGLLLASYSFSRKAQTTPRPCSRSPSSWPTRPPCRRRSTPHSLSSAAPSSRATW
jgi:leucyl aminopeptidase